jgi:hypothetical protein
MKLETSYRLLIISFTTLCVLSGCSLFGNPFIGPDAIKIADPPFAYIGLLLSGYIRSGKE